MRLNELSRSQRGLLLVTIVLVMMAVLLLAAEAAVRVRAILKYGYVSGVEKRLTIDPATGLRIPIPGSRQGPIVINSLGFRGPEIPVEKPPGLIRLAFLGGSTTYCAEVSGNDKTWPDIVTRELQQQYPDVRFDYINAGAPGYGVKHLKQTLDARVARLQPDVIVIYEATNDLSGNSYRLAQEQGVIQERPDQQRSWLSDYSLLYRLIELNLNIKSRQDKVEEKVGKMTVDVPALTAPFRRDLSALITDAASLAPLVAVTTFSVQYRRDQARERQIDAAESSLYYMPYMTIPALLDGFDAYNGVIRDLAAANDALLIDGENEIPGDPAHFNDSVHFTDAGSAAQARRVAAVLKSSPRLQALVAERRAQVLAR